MDTTFGGRRSGAAHAGSVAEDDIDLTIAPDEPLPRTMLAHALLIGLAGDLLLRDPPVGIAFPLWTAILTLGMTSLAWRSGREVSREAAAWLATAVLFSTGLAWRDSGMLHALDFLATAGALCMAAIALGNARAALLAERLRDTVWAVAALARSVAAGFVPLAVRELSAPGVRGHWPSRARPVLRTILIVGTIVFVFGSLLRGADPIFASLVELPQLDLGELVSHLMVVGFFTWIVSGWTRGALVADLQKARAPDSIPFGLSALDVAAALGTLNALFAAFVVTQLGWFFGGERFLHARTGLTAAAYARQGFFEMLWVVLLVVPLLVATRAALQPGRALARRHTALSLPMIALLGAIIFSAVTRMRLYVHYYGLTTDRFYPLVFMGWLAVVLVWLALTVLRGRGRPFVAGVAVSGLCVLAALNVAAPDAIVARFNLDRASHAQRDAEVTLDLRHMARLSGDAAAVAARATLNPPLGAAGSSARAEDDAQRCFAARVLLDRWGQNSLSVRRRSLDASWRSWNSGQVSAIRAIGEHSAALRTVKQEVCARVPKVRR